MTYFARYDKNTGKILSTGFMADEYIEKERIENGDIVTLSAPILNPEKSYLNIGTGEIYQVEPPPPSPPTYQELRAPEYPPLSTLADAIYWQTQGDNSLMDKWIAACDIVKQKYPKPTSNTSNTSNT